MNRITVLEEEFKKRYNRDIELKRLEPSTVHSTKLEIVSPKKTKFIITEYRKDGLTDYVTLEYKNKLYKFSRYVDAEIQIADVIGGEEYGNSR